MFAPFLVFAVPSAIALGISYLISLTLFYVVISIIAAIVACITVYLVFDALGIVIFDRDNATREIPGRSEWAVNSCAGPGEGSKTLQYGPRGWGRYTDDGKFWPSS